MISIRSEWKWARAHKNRAGTHTKKMHAKHNRHVKLGRKWENNSRFDGNYRFISDLAEIVLKRRRFPTSMAHKNTFDIRAIELSLRREREHFCASSASMERTESSIIPRERGTINNFDLNHAPFTEKKSGRHIYLNGARWFACLAGSFIEFFLLVCFSSPLSTTNSLNEITLNILTELMWLYSWRPSCHGCSRSQDKLAGRSVWLRPNEVNPAAKT